MKRISNEWKSKELSKRLAILTQSNNIQMKLTVRELVNFGRFPYSGGRVTQEDQVIVDQANSLHGTGKRDLKMQFIDELSGTTASAGIHCHGNRSGYGICAVAE